MVKKISKRGNGAVLDYNEWNWLHDLLASGSGVPDAAIKYHFTGSDALVIGSNGQDIFKVNLNGLHLNKIDFSEIGGANPTIKIPVGSKLTIEDGVASILTFEDGTLDMTGASVDQSIKLHNDGAGNVITLQREFSGYSNRLKMLIEEPGFSGGWYFSGNGIVAMQNTYLNIIKHDSDNSISLGAGGWTNIKSSGGYIRHTSNELLIEEPTFGEYCAIQQFANLMRLRFPGTNPSIHLVGNDGDGGERTLSLQYFSDSDEFIITNDSVQTLSIKEGEISILGDPGVQASVGKWDGDKIYLNFNPDGSYGDGNWGYFAFSDNDDAFHWNIGGNDIVYLWSDGKLNINNYAEFQKQGNESRLYMSTTNDFFANITVRDGNHLRIELENGAGGTDTRFELDHTNGLKLFNTGASVTEFSTDGTLGDNSDSAVPTEKAVKAYVDNVAERTSSGTNIKADANYGINIDTSGTKATADATTRGQLFLEKGTTGSRDRLYICLKSDSDTYSWVEIANGGA